jgi:hypothetical protein
VRPLPSIIAITALAALTSCSAGDCLSIGRPSLHLTVEDAATGAPVSLTGAVLVVWVEGVTDSVNTSRPGMTNSYTRFVDTGPATIHLAQQGYVAWDTSFVITTSGHCHDPDLATVVARLRRA